MKCRLLFCRPNPSSRFFKARFVGFFVPFVGQFAVAFRAEAVFIHHRQIVHAFRAVVAGGKLIIQEGFAVVFRRALPVVMQGSQFVLRLAKFVAAGLFVI